MEGHKIKSCHNCFHMYYNQDELCDNEIVCTCDIDNHYIGYPDEAEMETCEQWKEETN